MPPRKKKAAAASTGLAAAETGEGKPPVEVQQLAAQVEKDGGRVLATHREPLGSAWVRFSALPIDQVEPTPYQRELSETRAERLASAAAHGGGEGGA